MWAGELGEGWAPGAGVGTGGGGGGRGGKEEVSGDLGPWEKPDSYEARCEFRRVDAAACAVEAGAEGVGGACWGHDLAAGVGGLAGGVDVAVWRGEVSAEGGGGRVVVDGAAGGGV